MSIALELKVDGLEDVQRKFNDLLQPDLEQLLDNIGAEVVSQTQSRISDDKADPDGTPWAEWTDRYAGTRNSGQSLLEDSGRLNNSISHLVVGDTVEVGSNLVYAGHHQFGSEKKSGRGSGVPARQFLGLSDHNMDEVEIIVNNFIEDLLSK
jgi:phage virion morphogenesis protein